MKYQKTIKFSSTDDLGVLALVKQGIEAYKKERDLW